MKIHIDIIRRVDADIELTNLEDSVSPTRQFYQRKKLQMRYIQNSLNHYQVAQDLVWQTICEKNIDVVTTREPYRCIWVKIMGLWNISFPVSNGVSGGWAYQSEFEKSSYIWLVIIARDFEA